MFDTSLMDLFNVMPNHYYNRCVVKLQYFKIKRNNFVRNDMFFFSNFEYIFHLLLFTSEIEKKVKVNLKTIWQMTAYVTPTIWKTAFVTWVHLRYCSMFRRILVCKWCYCYCSARHMQRLLHSIHFTAIQSMQFYFQCNLISSTCIVGKYFIDYFIK